MFNGDTKDRSAHAWVGGRPAVYLNPRLGSAPASCRYVAVYVAKEAAELMLKDFPESAEKRYIVSSRMAETFFELGGTRMTMSDIDGHKDVQAEAAIKLWVENDPVGGMALLHAQGAPSLAEVRAKDPVAADAALRQFELFKAQERDWLLQNQGMLQ
jgi:hypothetical protein